MRFGYVVVVCALAACEVRNGTYFVVDGERAGIEFDQVEFFLGKDTGGADLYTPLRQWNAIAGSAVDQRLQLTKRQYTETDLQTSPASTSLTYYLPATPGNTEAHYALVVASRGGVAVGIGEVEEYNVFDDAAYMYDVPLVQVPDDGSYERWGTEPDVLAKACVRWTRVREGDDKESTYAVVREDDRDCDGVPTTKECDDLNYCVPQGTVPCVVRQIGCISATCDLGTCSDATELTAGVKTCNAETCLPEAFCVPGDDCRENGPADQFLACAIKIGMTHTEVVMPVKTSGGGLCVHAFVAYPPEGLSCDTPMIEWPRSGIVGSWTFSVTQSINEPAACEFTLDGPAVDAPPPSDTHLVVSVAFDSAGERRTSFVVGFAPSGTPGCNITLQPPMPLMGQPNPTCP